MALLRRCVLAVVLSVGGGALALPATAHGEDHATTYVVVDGDTLIGIAAKSRVSLADLLRVNDLTLTSLIVPGQRLDLPASSGGGASTSPSTPAASSGGTHVVQWGDTLIGIANRAGVSLGSLLAANNLTVDSLIMPGVTLRLPAGATTSATGNTAAGTSSAPSPAASAAPSPAASYTVRAGDTLSGIAVRHGVSLGALLRSNDMTVTSLIVPGMSLDLPDGAVTTSTGATSTATPAAAATPVETVVNYALAQVGKPYEFFAKGPDSFDCSGLTLAAYAQVGIDLVHYSAYQANQGTAVDFHNEPIRPGDLIFQTRRGSETINHVGIAVTSTTWIQAVGTGYDVRLGPMPSASSITSVRRYLDT